jgi:hypothetical protein
MLRTKKQSAMRQRRCFIPKNKTQWSKGSISSPKTKRSGAKEMFYPQKQSAVMRKQDFSSKNKVQWDKSNISAPKTKRSEAKAIFRLQKHLFLICRRMQRLKNKAQRDAGSILPQKHLFLRMPEKFWDCGCAAEAGDGSIWCCAACILGEIKGRVCRLRVFAYICRQNCHFKRPFKVTFFLQAYSLSA